MVEPPSWKNMSQNGNVPQIGMNITNIWNHQLVYLGYLLHLRHPCRGFLQPMLLVDMTTRGFTWSIHPWPKKFSFSRPSIVIYLEDLLYFTGRYLFPLFSTSYVVRSGLNYENIGGRRKKTMKARKAWLWLYFRCSGSRPPFHSRKQPRSLS